jgi:hypothetical protein
MLEIYKYSAEIKHDKGTYNIITVASCIESVKTIICKAENCPESAIISITKLHKIN